MISSFPWVLIALLVLILLFIIFVIITIRKKKEMPKPDYRAFFYLGLIFLFVYIIGSLFGRGEPSSIFLILGIVYFTVGLTHKDKWGKKEPMGLDHKKTVIALIIAGILVFLIGLVFYFLQVFK